MDKRKIFDYEPPEQTYNPKPVVIVCDATFYGNRKDKLGTLVFKNITQNEILIWKHIETETVEDYKQLLHYLLFIGYTVNAIMTDGFEGLHKAFKDYPIQLCHFHQREKYKDVLLVKSINLTTKKTSYTHPKIVSAYKSIRRNIPYLFTYKNIQTLK